MRSSASLRSRAPLILAAMVAILTLAGCTSGPSAADEARSALVKLAKESIRTAQSVVQSSPAQDAAAELLAGGTGVPFWNGVPDAQAPPFGFQAAAITAARADGDHVIASFVVGAGGHSGSGDLYKTAQAYACFVATFGADRPPVIKDGACPATSGFGSGRGFRVHAASLD